jgi:hypothetical protein
MADQQHETLEQKVTRWLHKKRLLPDEDWVERVVLQRRVRNVPNDAGTAVAMLPDLLQVFFQTLSGYDLCRYQRVCKQWCRMSKDILQARLRALGPPLGATGSMVGRITKAAAEEVDWARVGVLPHGGRIHKQALLPVIKTLLWNDHQQQVWFIVRHYALDHSSLSQLVDHVATHRRIETLELLLRENRLDYLMMAEPTIRLCKGSDKLALRMRALFRSCHDRLWHEYHQDGRITALWPFEGLHRDYRKNQFVE